MRKICLLMLFAAVVAAIVSCRDDGRARGVLRLADRLMEERPDSSLALLRRDSLLFEDAGRDVRMAYVLLRTEAEDKCYVTHVSDSAMLPAAKYFAAHGTPLQSVRAWYVLGRVYCDLRLYGHALTAFDNALAVNAGGDPAACRYKSRACTWAGDVYEWKGLYDKTLDYDKRAYKYAQRADVPSVLVYALRDVGRSYSYLTKNDVAIPYYQRAAEKAKAINDAYLYNMVMEELASIYIEENRLGEAHKALSSQFVSRTEMDLSAHYFVLSVYHEAVGCLDFAIYYNKLGMPYAEPEIKMDVALDLARLYERTGDKLAALECYKEYAAYADTVECNEVVENADMLEHVERMIDVERENTALEGSKRRLALSLSVIVFIVLASSYFIVRHYAKVKRRIREQQERVKEYLRQRQEREEQNFKRNEERINELEKALSSSSEALTDVRVRLMRSEAEMLANSNERMQLRMMHRELLKVDFAETEVYKLYHDVMSSPTSADYHRLVAALNKTYDNFTIRLKDFYPRITENGIWICCMVKTGLTSKEVCLKSVYTKYSLT